MWEVLFKRSKYNNQLIWPSSAHTQHSIAIVLHYQIPIYIITIYFLSGFFVLLLDWLVWPSWKLYIFSVIKWEINYWKLRRTIFKSHQKPTNIESNRMRARNSMEIWCIILNAGLSVAIFTQSDYIEINIFCLGYPLADGGMWRGSGMLTRSGV